LAIGLSHEDAARFWFLPATPIIGAAALLECLSWRMCRSGSLGSTLAGALAAVIAAYLAVRFLVRYIRTEKLTPKETVQVLVLRIHEVFCGPFV
jgi:undecaprenyl-diphosphatase